MFLKLSKFFLYVSVFSILIVMTSIYFPFIGGKVYFFRTAIQLALIFLVLWWGFEAQAGELWSRCKEMFKKPLFAAVSSFALVFLLASLFAFDPNAAFWSNYERGEGGFMMLHYYGLFFLLVLLFKERKDWERLFWVSLIATVSMILYGVGSAVFVVNPETDTISNPFSFVGPYIDGGKLAAPTFSERLFGNTRFQGSLGNPAYVSPYLIFSLFYLLWLWFSEKKASLNKNIIYGLLAFFFVVFFVLAKTRGAFVGLAGGVFVFLLAMALQSASAKLKRNFLILAAVFLVVLGSLIYYNDTNFVKSLPGSRFFQLDFSEQTFQTRLWTWNSAWQGFKERPILGWGPENFSAVFDKYFDPRHFNPGKQSETWFDYAHSVIFDYLSETGVLGLLSFLSVFAILYWELFKKLKNESPAVSALIVALPAAYLIQGLALFNVLPIYINLFLFLAFVCYKFYYSEKSTG